MPRSPRPLPGSLPAAFSVSAARAVGVTVRRLRHPTLAAPFRGARHRPPHDDVPDEERDADVSPIAREAAVLRAEIRRLAHAFATVAPDDWFFSHITAAVLWGLPLPIRLLRTAVRAQTRNGVTSPPRGIDVAALAPRRSSRARGVCGHQLQPALASVREVGGLRVSSPATTWALLADLLTVDELIELGDAIVHIPRRKGMRRGDAGDALGTPAELRAAASVPYRRRAGKLRAALAEIRVGSASPGETRTRLACVRGGLPEPELDVDVLADDGRPIGYTELAYPAFRILIEYEGDHHRTGRAQWQRDVDKHAACAEAGWTVVRLTAAHVYPSADLAVQRIRSALLRAGWSPQ
ncbi:hypothetical protein [Microbacterium sp.]|uniref:hypothetical protein n=1 Tax=Microbacterium sp. TaxID=51671 RepID=UPI0037C96D97